MSILQIAQDLNITLPKHERPNGSRKATNCRPTALRSMWDGLWEGFAAYRHFEYLKSWRASDDAAVRHALARKWTDSSVNETSPV